MLIHQPSPEDLYTIFATNVTTIRSDVEDFANALRDERHKEILKQAHESRIQSDEDIRGWRVTEHEDWFDVHNVDSPRNLEADGTKGSDPDAAQRVTIDSERLHAVIEQFKNVNPGIEVSLDEDTRLIRVRLRLLAPTHNAAKTTRSLFLLKHTRISRSTNSRVMGVVQRTMSLRLRRQACMQLS